MHKAHISLLALQFTNYNIPKSWSVTRSINLFKGCQWLVTVHLLFSAYTGSKTYSCIASFSSSNKPNWHFTKISNQKWELANKNEVQQRNKIIVEMKFVSGVTEEIVDYGNIDTNTKTRYAATWL